MALDTNFNIKEIDTWPIFLTVIASIVCACLIVFFSWSLFITDKDDELTNLENTETKLRDEFATKAKQAANLEQYKEQIIELESLLDAQLRQLPNSNEVANLLDDISFIAQDNGLNLISIKWEQEGKKDVYTELPMRIVVTGTYEQLGSFAADVAALPRIVTIDQFDLAHADKKGKDSQTDLLEMNLLAKTFRYNAEEAKKQNERKSRRGRR
ncbi:MAG: type 4a pilus biogenesis protein PilO [Succinivibrionaceae bacterium]